jgi:hypothetical protein
MNNELVVKCKEMLKKLKSVCEESVEEFNIPELNDLIEELDNCSDRPSFITDDLMIVLRYEYKLNKLTAIKHLCEVSRAYMDSPLKFSKEFCEENFEEKK